MEKLQIGGKYLLSLWKFLEFDVWSLSRSKTTLTSKKSLQFSRFRNKKLLLRVLSKQFCAYFLAQIWRYGFFLWKFNECEIERFKHTFAVVIQRTPLSVFLAAAGFRPVCTIAPREVPAARVRPGRAHIVTLPFRALRIRLLPRGLHAVGCNNTALHNSSLPPFHLNSKIHIFGMAQPEWIIYLGTIYVLIKANIKMSSYL